MRRCRVESYGPLPQITASRFRAAARFSVLRGIRAREGGAIDVGLREGGPHQTGEAQAAVGEVSESQSGEDQVGT